jgi:hypothetical protein
LRPQQLTWAWSSSAQVKPLPAQTWLMAIPTNPKTSTASGVLEKATEAGWPMAPLSLLPQHLTWPVASTAQV